jgi:hypothetical protein
LTLRAIGCLVAVMFAAASGRGSEPPVTTIERFQDLLKGVMRSETRLAGISPSGAIHTLVQPPDVRWFLGRAADEGVNAPGAPPGDSARVDVEVGLLDYGVRYDNLHRDGILGTRLVDRIVRLRVRTRFVERSTGRLLREADADTSAVDTVAVADIGAVEHPNLVATHGVIPAEGFFSGWAEPLVVVGSVVVAVFLLFTIRS